MRNKKLDHLTNLDFQIFERATKDVNVFTDWYFRSPGSGMKYSKSYPDTRVRAYWSELNAAWQDTIDTSTVEQPLQGVKVLSYKEKVWKWKGTDYEVLKDMEGDPIFWHHYGFLLQDWQKMAFHAPQPEQLIIGGYGSGKTAYIGISNAVFAAMFPFFRGIVVAPQMIQAMEVHKFITRITSDTPWYERWVISAPTHHYPGFLLANDFIGESRIELLSVEDDAEKVRTLEGDTVYLDQAEKIVDLDDMVRELGSRTRGMVRDRPRIGRLCLTANAGDNAALWYRYDLGSVEPETYLSITVKTSENLSISNEDLKRLSRRVGGTPETIQRWLEGQRPEGEGEHFPPRVIGLCTDRGLNMIMDSRVRERSETTGPPQLLEFLEKFVSKTEPRAGVYHWELPPDHLSKRVYIVIGDPGQGDPPYRNAGCLMAWDITDFPKAPMVLRAFHWVHGKGEYWPFISEFERMVDLYNARGRCAFDATGMGKGFNELVFEQLNLMVEPMDMSGPSGKYASLNALKLLMGRGMLKFPYIASINLQLSHYKLPDEKLPQDIVMTMAMSAQYVRQFYWYDKEVSNTELAKIQVVENLIRKVNRHERDPRDRYRRSR